MHELAYNLLLHNFFFNKLLIIFSQSKVKVLYGTRGAFKKRPVTVYCCNAPRRWKEHNNNYYHIGNLHVLRRIRLREKLFILGVVVEE